MNRGYIKFWRKAEDSVSWTRGLEYRGMMVTILDRAAWQPRFEWGVRVQPGEFLVKVVAWAETLGMSESSLRRMLKNLVEDGFIAVSNAANRYSKITVVNWHVYQQAEGVSRRADGGPANARTVHRQRTDDEPSYKEEEGKKERREDPPTAPQGGTDGDMRRCDRGGLKADAATAPQGGTQGDTRTAFARFWQAYPKKTGKDAALKAWQKTKGKPDIAAILAAVAQQKTWPQWRRDDGRYIPNPATWLNQGRWADEPPEAQSCAPGVAPPLSAEETARRRAEGERLLAAMRAKARAENRSMADSVGRRHEPG